MMHKKQKQGFRKAAAILLLLTPALFGQDTHTTMQPSHLVLVSIPDRKLAVVENGRILRTFSVAVGSVNSPSPAGKFRVVARLKDPTYYHPGVVIPPGPDNPIGPRWVGLDKKGFGIHGTNEPRSIGKAASHGCIRLRNREVVEFFRLVNVGDVVKIRAERDEEIARVFGGAEHSTTQVAMNGPQPMGAGQ